jgi:class 3 adenylate cyclase/tetratricopeptide (TPR) repeat protein
MDCPQCGFANAAGAKFCNECGQRLERFASPRSYTPKHLADKILTSQSVMTGERKQVTVMFTDVSGFTAISSRLDPEDVHEIMDRCFEILLHAVHRYEGTINQFLGDGVMALFGAPIAHEDHPHRALRAALAIQSDLAPLREEVRRRHGVDFRLRIGLNTGLVVVGAIGRDLRMDYTAVGDTTNLASRILNIAQPGQIALSAPVFRLTEGYFAFEDLGAFEVKGKTEPIHVYAVTAERRGRTRLEVSRDRGLTPFVGRQHELDFLLAAFERAVGRRGSTVLLIGEPGAGKSRLLYEFAHRVEETGARLFEGAGVSFGASIPYGPILDLLQRSLGVREGVTGEELRTLVSDRLALLGLGGDENATLLAHLLGVAAPREFVERLSGNELKARTFGVLRDLVLAASRSKPVVLIVENAHWFDPSSAEFLAELTGALADHPVLLVVSTRPGFSAAWLASSRVSTIPLGRLHSGDVHAMVRTLLAAAPSDDLCEVLIDKSEGNPLYVEEIVRQLREADRILVEDGVARLRTGDIAVPSTIHDIIAARVDRLPEALKPTLQTAAVIGRRFAIPLLCRVVERSSQFVDEHLGELHRLDFVFPTPRDTEAMYSFKHALTQDVVYAGLLERRRRQYHAAAGTGLEEIYAGRIDDMVELLAYHFGRSSEDEKAVDYAIRAGEKAQQRWANTEALAAFESALARLDSMPDTEANRRRRIDAVIAQAEIKFALGRHAEHVQTLESIRHLVDTSADAPRRAAWFYWAGFLHSLTGARPEISVAYCTQAVAIAEVEGLEVLLPYAECALSHCYLAAGSLEGSIDAGERALAVFEERGNAWWACRTLWALAPAANAMGAWQRSLDYCRKALDYGQSTNDLRLKVVGWWRTGSAHIMRGAPEEGRRCCERALALSPAPFDATMVRAMCGYASIKSGDVQAGVAEMEKAIDWFGQSQLRYSRVIFGARLCEGYLRLGESKRARALLEEFLAISRDGGYLHAEGLVERILGEAVTPDDPAGAAAHLESAAVIFEQVGARDELARVLVAQAELLRRAHDPDGARALLERALALFDACGTVDEPARVRALLERTE